MKRSTSRKLPHVYERGRLGKEGNLWIGEIGIMLVPEIHRRYQREGLRTVPCGSMRVQENRRRQRRDRYVVYVDDLLLASKTKEDEGRTSSDLSSCFKIKDLGEAEFYLNVISRGTRKQDH